MKNMMRCPVLLYCLTVSGMMYLGGYLGYEMAIKEFIKKLNEYSNDHPDKTMAEFAEECSEK